jgi:hypothetical protein
MCQVTIESALLRKGNTLFRDGLMAIQGILHGSIYAVAMEDWAYLYFDSKIVLVILFF